MIILPRRLPVSMGGRFCVFGGPHSQKGRCKRQRTVPCCHTGKHPAPLRAGGEYAGSAVVANAYFMLRGLGYRVSNRRLKPGVAGSRNPNRSGLTLRARADRPRQLCAK